MRNANRSLLQIRPNRLRPWRHRGAWGKEELCLKQWIFRNHSEVFPDLIGAHPYRLPQLIQPSHVVVHPKSTLRNPDRNLASLVVGILIRCQTDDSARRLKHIQIWHHKRASGAMLGEKARYARSSIKAHDRKSGK